MKQKNHNILEELRSRFADGEKLTVVNIIEDCFSPKSPYDYLVAKAKVKQGITYLKRWFRTHEGLWFGGLDNEGHFGLVTNEAEVRYALTSYYKFVKGNIASASLLVGNAREGNLLPAGMQNERLLVARIVEEEDEKSTH